MVEKAFHVGFLGEFGENGVGVQWLVEGFSGGWGSPWGLGCLKMLTFLQKPPNPQTPKAGRGGLKQTPRLPFF